MAEHQPDPEACTSGTALAAATTSSEHGRVSSTLRSERGEVASWLILMAALAAIAASLAGILTVIFSQLAGGLAGAAENGLAIPDVAGPSAPGNGPAATAIDPDADPLPVDTSHCSLTVTASGGLVGLGVGVGGTIELIIQTMPDGSQIVTIAGDGMINGGTGSSAGAGVTVNDATVGAYASASADAWGSLGAGVQYELAPGESLSDLFAGLAVSSNPVTGLGAAGINLIFPGDPIPTAELPDTVFVDGSVWGTAGGTAQAGVGWVSAGANADAQAGVHQAYAVHDNGTYSATTTYSGELSGDVGVTGGIPFFAWGTGGFAAEAQGSVSVQTIYDSDFNAVEMIVTTSYGYDGDAILGSDDDNPTITTQQWALDLNDPEVAAAVENLDAFVPGVNPIPDIPTGNPLDSWDVVTENASTSGPVSQELSTTELDIAFEAGAIVADVSGGLNGNCTQLQ